MPSWGIQSLFHPPSGILYVYWDCWCLSTMQESWTRTDDLEIEVLSWNKGKANRADIARRKNVNSNPLRLWICLLCNDWTTEIKPLPIYNYVSLSKWKEKRKCRVYRRRSQGFVNENSMNFTCNKPLFMIIVYAC